MISNMLIGAKRALLTSAYQRDYMAMDRTGQSCSPMRRGAALSYSGALIVGAGGELNHTELVRWLKFHHLLPRSEPRTKAHALQLINQALGLLRITDEAA